MSDDTELRLRLRIAFLEGRLETICAAAGRVLAKVSMPAHVTAGSYSTSDTKRVPARPLATLRNLVMGKEDRHERLG
jgi:hypothetical protein